MALTMWLLRLQLFVSFVIVEWLFGRGEVHVVLLNTLLCDGVDFESWFAFGAKQWVNFTRTDIVWFMLVLLVYDRCGIFDCFVWCYWLLFVLLVKLFILVLLFDLQFVNEMGGGVWSLVELWRSLILFDHLLVVEIWSQFGLKFKIVRWIFIDRSWNFHCFGLQLLNRRGIVGSLALWNQLLFINKWLEFGRLDIDGLT